MALRAEELLDLGQYKIKEYLGEGSFGRVFRCIRDSD
jgi:hypothetical protein